MKTCLRLTCVAMIALATAPAQPQTFPLASRGVPVRGEITSNSSVAGSLTVELASNGTEVSETANVNGDGTFEFRSASPGTHWLRVVAGNNVIHEEIVNISGPGQTLSIHLKDQSSANRTAGSSVSMRQLTHKVPRQAQKAFDRGEQLLAKDDQPAAAELFRQAVALDPEFSDAYNELGAAEANMGKLPEAAEQFQKAINLVPEHRLALPNLSIVLAKMKRYHEAGEVARRALQLVPGAGPKMHYILAFGLMADHAEPQEAITNLKIASSEIPKAHIVAADVLVQCGRRDEAVQELEEYLRVQPSDDPERPKVQARLAELKH
jgi:tetratricopeptide (TPR) repeat protein